MRQAEIYRKDVLAGILTEDGGAERRDKPHREYA